MTITQPETLTPIQENVARGIIFLDAKFDRGWRKKPWQARIDVSTLDIAGCGSCVLGQLYGDYDDGNEALGLIGDVQARARLGFTSLLDCTGSEWGQLNDAWREYLTAWQEAHA